MKATRGRGRVARWGALAAVPLTIAATLSGASSAGASLPSTIHLYSIDDNSGPAGAVGVDATQAYELAVSQINKEHFLGNTTLSFSVGDTGGSATTAANLATQAATAHYPIVFGPVSSSTAVAVAPILGRANQPTIFTQAGSSGVLVSKYIFRMTPLQTTQFRSRSNGSSPRGSRPCRCSTTRTSRPRRRWPRSSPPSGRSTA